MSLSQNFRFHLIREIIDWTPAKVSIPWKILVECENSGIDNDSKMY